MEFPPLTHLNVKFDMKIAINQPCGQNWEGMQPNNNGAFCLSCQKNVIDFTTKTLEQIKDFFANKPGNESVCARFRETQLEALAYNDFYERYKRWNYFQKAALIVFFVFGSRLFTGAQTQTKPVGTRTVTAASTGKDTCKAGSKPKSADESVRMGKAKIENQTRKKEKSERTLMGEPEVDPKREQ